MAILTNGKGGNRMKRKIVFLISIMICSFLSLSFTGSDGFGKISRELKSSGASIEKIDVEGHGYFKSDLSLTNIASSIYKLSGLIGTYNKVLKNNELVFENDQMLIRVKKTSSENLNYVSFNLSQYGDIQNINNIRSCIFKSFSRFDALPTFSYLISGKYDRKMTIKEMKNEASEILLVCGSDNISGIEDRNLVSYSGFSPLMHEKLNVLKKYTNLNIAFRYIKDEGTTNVLIGSPIIAVEY